MAVGDEQVEPAVIIDVEGDGAEAGLRAARGGEIRRQGAVGEQAAAEVPAQGVRLVDEVGVEQVDAAVAVEVLGDDAHAGRGLARPVVGDARRGADLLESQAPEVAEQEVRRPVVGHEEVEPAVAVEVGDGQAQAASARGPRSPPPG